MAFVGGGETITVSRRIAGAVDDFGNPTYTTETVTIRDVLIAIGSTSEPVDPARDATDANLTAYLPQGTLIAEGDVFIVHGERWVKDGSAQSWVSPFPATEAGVVVPLRRRHG